MMYGDFCGKGTTSVGRTKKKHTVYTCICTGCGKRLKGDALCFDLNPVIKKKLTEYATGKGEKSVVDKILNEYGNDHYGPALLSERELWEQTAGLTQVSAGRWQGTLQISLREWQNPRQKLSDEEIQLWSNVMALASKKCGGDSLQIPVDYHKISDGATRINMVRAADEEIDTRYCPICGEEMSFWSGQFPELVLTVVGGPRASKSTALTACASFFMEHGKRCGITWDGKEDLDGTWKDFKKRCLDPYNENRRVEPTQSGDRDAIPRFSARITVAGVEGMPRRDLILTVVDLPGEWDANSENGGIRLDSKIYKEYQEFYSNVDCVWYCTDQAELEQMDIEAATEDMKKKRAVLGYDPGRKLIRTSERVEKLNRYAGLFQKDIPVVFLLGKSDCYQNEVDDQDLYQKNYYQRNYEQKCDWIEIISGSSPVIYGRDYHKKALFLRKFLISRNAELVRGFEEAFSARTYIAVSCYGHAVKQNPDGQKPEPEPKEEPAKEPYQSELPLLWTLAVKGYLMVKDESEEHYAHKDRLTWERLCLYGPRLHTYGSTVHKGRSFRQRFFGKG